MKEKKDVVPFDAFSAINRVIFVAGYYTLDEGVKNWKKILYTFYKVLVIILIIVYNLQFIIYTFQSRDDLEKMTECLMLEIPYTNLFVKALTLFILDKRIQNLNKFLKDGIFSATNKADQEILQVHVKQMHLMSRLININAAVAASFWGLCSVLKRYINGQYEVTPMYTPYRTDTVPRFILLILNQIGPMLWIGNGHISIDILTVTYYAQAQIQLKIIRQQLNNLVDKTQNDRDYSKHEFQYKDLSDNRIRQKFILAVKRYEALKWYVEEVDSIFNVPLSFQFLSSAIAVCFVTYGMSIASTSFQFIFMMLLLVVLTTQIFMFCIVGNLVFIESQLLNDSLYESDWLSLSPPFRRQLLIAMVIWSKPVQPKVCRVLQLSLSTFLAIIKASYSLYTILHNTNVED